MNVSHLTLGRYLTGELDEAESAQVAAAIAADDALQAQVARIEQAKDVVAPFDAASLRARAHEAPVAANDNRAFLAVIPLLLAAAVALFFIIPSVPPSDGLRGAGLLQVYHLESAGLSSYDARPLGQGDVLGFKVDPGAHDSMVLLSVDARGSVSVHYPTSGSSEPLPGEGLQALPGSIVLDAAPGPELFVAVFGKTVDTAQAEAERAWQAGGVGGLHDWAASDDVDVAVVTRR